MGGAKAAIESTDRLEVTALLADLPRARRWVLPALLRVQRARGFVSDSAIQAIAAHLRLTPADLEGIASGYPEIARTPPVQHEVRICVDLSCWLRGAEALLSDVQCRVVQSSPRSDARVAGSGCLFVCPLAPAVAVNGRVLGRATPDSVISALEPNVSLDVS